MGPSNLAETLIQHPVLCRGASFDLRLDQSSQQQQQRQRQHQPTQNSVGGGGSSNITCFLTTEFVSPHPEATAGAISQRLATRITNSAGENTNPLSTIFGF